VKPIGGEFGPAELSKAMAQVVLALDSKAAVIGGEITEETELNTILDAVQKIKRSVEVRSFLTPDRPPRTHIAHTIPFLKNCRFWENT